MDNVWPVVIAHIDGDSFFASCIQSVYPQLRGIPLVVGRERKIATAVSYEAKKLGIKRGMPISEIVRHFPTCVVSDSDYHLYEVISSKMVAVVKKFSPIIEIFSIDEVFIDLSMYGSGRTQLDIAHMIQREIESSLSISVSIGVSVNKTLAKMASSANKPHGYTIVTQADIVSFLRQQPIDAICGIGSQLRRKFISYGLHTCYDLYIKDKQFVAVLYNKTILELYRELHGEYVNPVDPSIKDTYKSISKFHTFTQPSSSKKYVLAQFVHNIDLACFKAARFKLAPRRIECFVRLQTMRYLHIQINLPMATNISGDIFKQLQKPLERLIERSKLYRQVGIILTDFVADEYIQQNLFSHDAFRSTKLKKTILEIKEKYGMHMICWGQEKQFAADIHIHKGWKKSQGDLFVFSKVS